MKILAIDPATKCGWAISRNIYGIWDLKTRRDESTGMKLLRLKAKISEICEKEKIELIVFERPAGRNKTDIISHAKLQAVIEEYCLLNGIDYKGYSPGEMKLFATGKGNCNKQMMVDAARSKLKYTGNDDNEADALWLLELAKTELNLL